MPDQNYMDLIVNTKFATSFPLQKITRINDRLSVFHEPAEPLNMCILGNQPYAIFPHIFTLNSTYSLDKSNVPYFQYNSNFSLFGRGVLIGFVDTGIDYRHPAFLNQDGSTRIYSIWDQTISQGVPPQQFPFGSEFKKTDINFALRQTDPLSAVPTQDENGHGTMLAGIAAGGANLEKDFSGIAINAELVVVKLKQANKSNREVFCVRDDIDCYLESDLLLGVEYIRSVSAQLNRPLVLCIGMGSSQGEHNGESTFPAYLNELASDPGVAICVAAGNEGTSGRHYRGIITSSNYTNEFDLRVGPQDKTFFFELWNQSPSRLAVTVVTPSGESTQVIYPKLQGCHIFHFIFEPSTLYINNFIMEEETGMQLILARFQNASSGIWKIRVTSIDEKPALFDVWLPSGTIITGETRFLEPTPDITVTNPGNARNPLVVSAYDQYRDSILQHSSRGFSLSNHVVPDLAAPGLLLPCPLPNGLYGAATGTGAAAAHASGIVAMIMEWAILQGNYTTMTGKDVTRLLINGARQSGMYTYPNTSWGYGQIDIMGFFNHLRH